MSDKENDYEGQIEELDDEPTHEAPPKPKEEEQKEAEGVRFFPWGQNSHFIGGPKGIAIIPKSLAGKYPYPKPSGNAEGAHPVPGGLEEAEYDLKSLYEMVSGRVGELEAENKRLTDELEKMKADLAKKKKKEDMPEPGSEEAAKKKADEDKMKEDEAKKKKENAERKSDQVKTEKPGEAEFSDGVQELTYLLQEHQKRGRL